MERYFKVEESELLELLRSRRILDIIYDDDFIDSVDQEVNDSIEEHEEVEE